MAKSCKLCNCKNKLLFGVPKDAKRQKLWSEACGIPLKMGMQICEVHFKSGDIINGKNKSNFKRLKPDAVPLNLNTKSPIEIKIEPDLDMLCEKDDDPLELAQPTIVKVEESNACDINLIHEEQFDAHNKTTSGFVEDKRLNCGRIDMLLQNEKFVLNCHYCGEDYEIDEYQNFITHIKKEHTKDLDNNKQFNTKEVDSSKIVGVDNSDVINIKPEHGIRRKLVQLHSDVESSNDEFDNIDNDDDVDYEPKSKKGKQGKDEVQQKAKKGSNKSVQLEESETKKADEKNLLTFNTKPKTHVIAFLELIKSNAILWHRRQSILKRFDETLAKVLVDFNAKFNKNHLTSEEARLSINRIKDLYYRVTDPKHKRPIKNSKHKIQFPEFFEHCKAIDENSKKVVYSCDKCRAFFFKEIDLQIHRFKRYNIGELPFKCSRCNYGFAKAETRDEHEAKHNKTHICDVCNKGFISEEKLQAHAVVHTNDSKPVCEICGQLFITYRRYRRHKLRHEPPKEKCHICGKLYYEKWNLSEHVKSHLNERQYSCDVCGKTYNHQNDVTIHKRVVHNIKPQKQRFMWVNKNESNDNSDENDDSNDYDQQNSKDNDDDDDDEANLSMLSTHIFEENEK